MTKRTITKEEAIKLVNKKLAESGFDLNLKYENFKYRPCNYRVTRILDLEIPKQQTKLFKELKLRIDATLYPFQENENFDFDFDKISGFRIDFDYDYVHPRGSNGYMSHVLYDAEYDEYSED